MDDFQFALQVGLFIQYRFDRGLLPGLFYIQDDWKEAITTFFRVRNIFMQNQNEV